MPNVEGCSVTFNTAGVNAALKKMNKDFDRATMYGVRAAGRKVKQAMAKRAPVYDGDRIDIPKGRLKKSVHSSKRLTSHGEGTYGVFVGPMSQAVGPYRAKAEEQTGFVRAGYDAAGPALAEAFRVAFTRVIDKAGEGPGVLSGLGAALKGGG